MTDTTHSLVSDLRRLIQSKKKDFLGIAEAAGLSPNVDFRNVEIRNIDLRGQDLTMFDFTNADFTGSWIAGARFNHTVTPAQLERASDVAPTLGSPPRPTLLLGSDLASQAEATAAELGGRFRVLTDAYDSLRKLIQAKPRSPRARVYNALSDLLDHPGHGHEHPANDMERNLCLFAEARDDIDVSIIRLALEAWTFSPRRQAVAVLGGPRVSLGAAAEHPDVKLLFEAFASHLILVRTGEPDAGLSTRRKGASKGQSSASMREAIQVLGMMARSTPSNRDRDAESDAQVNAGPLAAQIRFPVRLASQTIRSELKSTLSPEVDPAGVRCVLLVSEALGERAMAARAPVDGIPIELRAVPPWERDLAMILASRSSPFWRVFP